MARPNSATVALLQSLLADARKGEVQEVFVHYRYDDGVTDYEYTHDDVPDLLYELGSAILLEKSAAARDFGTA